MVEQSITFPPPTGEGDDKKRKASRSLSHITTPGQEEEGQQDEQTTPQQQAEDISMDRQSPEGNGTQSKDLGQKLSKF